MNVSEPKPTTAEWTANVDKSALGTKSISSLRSDQTVTTIEIIFASAQLSSDLIELFWTRAFNSACSLQLSVINQMAVLCGMLTIQYSAQSGRLSVHKLFTSCIRRGIVSRDSIVDGDWLPATEWCQLYLPCCQPASDVSENFWEYVPCTACPAWPAEWL